MRPTRALLAVIALGSVLLLPASAVAGTSSYQRVLQAYEHAGTIPACQFSSSEPGPWALEQTDRPRQSGDQDGDRCEPPDRRPPTRS